MDEILKPFVADILKLEKVGITDFVTYCLTDLDFHRMRVLSFTQPRDPAISEEHCLFVQLITLPAMSWVASRISLVPCENVAYA